MDYFMQGPVTKSVTIEELVSIITIEPGRERLLNRFNPVLSRVNLGFR